MHGVVIFLVEVQNGSKPISREGIGMRIGRKGGEIPCKRGDCCSLGQDQVLKSDGHR